MPDETIHEVAPQGTGPNQQTLLLQGVDEVVREENRAKAHVHSRVEHVFAVIKPKFGYRRIMKNANPVFKGPDDSRNSPLVKVLSVALGADLSRIPSRDEDGISCRQSETQRPPDAGEDQSPMARGDAIGGQ